ncbi:MAG TPA: DUF6152 family protein, partial [Vicinamibacterales bacterium]|nr:DUF6152 family protein [Vicinamibacterales bacterium]
MNTRVLVVIVALCTGPGISVAHHSFSAEYDGSKPTIKKGVVKRVSWVNPHSYIYIDIDGVEWALEGFPVAGLRRQGFGRFAVKEGDELSVVGWPARNGTSRLQA